MAGLEGQKIGDCEIIAKLGQGGMGAVYKARQPELDRLVAVKFLPRDWSDDSDFVARFKREAASAARLNHPNMVQVYTAGKHEDTYYFVMEFVDGEDVQQRLDRKGRLHPAEAVTIALCVAQALDYGWKRAKLIHRDIKPDNIYLSNNGEVKLGDLGLAKSVSSTLTGLTPFGGSMGTPHFVSPEQARGNRDVDFRADIYSLGCTLYYMLTGQLPYGRDGDALAIVHKHVYEPPPAILKVWPDCPPALAALVTRMVEKKPEDRYQNYDEVTAEMQCILDSLPPVPSAAVTDVPSVSARSSAVRHVPTLPAESVAGHPRFPPVAVGGGTGVKFLQDQINGARDGVSLVVVPPDVAEIQERLIVNKDLVLDGNSATLWVRTGPVLTITGGHKVTLRNLTIEVADPAQPALIVTPPHAVKCDNVFAAGPTKGIAEGQVWSYPRVLVLRLCPSESSNVSLTVPEPCTLHCEIEGCKDVVSPLASGVNTVSLAPPSDAVPGTPLRGLMCIVPVNGGRERVVPVFGWVRNPLPRDPPSPLPDQWKHRLNKQWKQRLALIFALLGVAAVVLFIIPHIRLSCEHPRERAVHVTPTKIDFGTLSYGDDRNASATLLISFTYSPRTLTNLWVTIVWDGTQTIYSAKGVSRQESLRRIEEPPFALTNSPAVWPLSLEMNGVGEDPQVYEGIITIIVNDPAVQVIPNQIPWKAEAKLRSR